MECIKITARLVDGFVSSDKWSPSIDGILAYRHVMNSIGSDRFALTQGNDSLMEPVEGLPVKVISSGDWWWYACSFPCFDMSRKEKKHFHRRFDQQHSDHIHLGKKSGNVQVKAGPFKNYRRSIYKTLCDSISWHVIGDKLKIMQLLDEVTHVGAKHAQGYGEVVEWIIGKGDDDKALLYRPLPVDYAKSKKIVGYEMLYGIRPPARLPKNKTVCIIPDE